MNARTIKVAAKSELEATYKVAIHYTLVNFMPPIPADGESIWTVHITATREPNATEEGTVKP